MREEDAIQIFAVVEISSVLSLHVTFSLIIGVKVACPPPRPEAD